LSALRRIDGDRAAGVVVDARAGRRARPGCRDVLSRTPGESCAEPGAMAHGLPARGRYMTRRQRCERRQAHAPTLASHRSPGAHYTRTPSPSPR
jgi:hypothetical protein